MENIMPTLRELYEKHADTGKVSDKWSIYLEEYNTLFSPYRNQELTFLEVGIQNGGSLEIWAQYFPVAKRIIGCDIEPNCAQLQYAESNISVVVGDANANDTQKAVFALEPTFDIIVDDGSHTSSDIIKTFVKYFSSVRDGGIFVAEDLHCSYWEEYEGGLFDLYSAIAFFKFLVDSVNFEHWGVDRSLRVELLQQFAGHYQIEIDESLLEGIHSVEFINSLCVIRKKPAAENQLGKRVVVGKEALANAKMSPEKNGTVSETPSQVGNKFSQIEASPVEFLNSYNELLNSHDTLRKRYIVLEEQNSIAEQTITEMRQSKFWRLRDVYMRLKKTLLGRVGR